MKFYLCLIFAVLFAVAVVPCFAQDADAVIFHMHSTHTAFPDTGRAKGHMYAKVLYTEAEHYHDSTVLVIAPKKLDARKKVDLIYWFHGWGNNVDSTASFYQLTRQFLASHVNAVLILAETARNAPDGYGGKLENAGVFKALTADVLAELKTRKLIGKDCQPDYVLLGGHSGAYRVMANIIKNGQVPINQVMMFDALYANTNDFMTWIKADSCHRFSQIYTDHGGTLAESKRMVKLLDDEHLSYTETEESALTQQLVKSNRLIFIHSPHQHNDIICNPDNFLLFLENSPFLKMRR